MFSNNKIPGALDDEEEEQPLVLRERARDLPEEDDEEEMGVRFLKRPKYMGPKESDAEDSES